MTPYDYGYRRGKGDAQAALDPGTVGPNGTGGYRQVQPGPMPDLKPVGVEVRTEWLRGYAQGITDALASSRPVIRMTLDGTITGMGRVV
jgi:hypothetical protein